ncbi:MAG: molybdopterin-dependent oxidoreductase [Nitrososphaerales archaeon]
MGKLVRRDFIKTFALLGGTTVFLTLLPRLSNIERIVAYKEALKEGKPLNPLLEPGNILYSVCQQCNTQCGIKVKLLDGIVAKIEGNPYSPWTLHPHIDYYTPLIEATKIDGALCPKGQAGIQTQYDPYRVVKVLKRAGKRGENKWISISFEQAIDEIVNGGYLFKHVAEEENRYVPGLKELWALRDPKLSSEMSNDVKNIWEGKMNVNEFKSKWKDHLHVLIDPDHPDLGPKNNQVVVMWGRLKGGRSDFIHRFFGDSFGTINRHGHTTVCQGSLYFACKAMSEQYIVDPKTKVGKWEKGEKFYWQADQENSEFIIFVGASPFEGNYGPTNRTFGITDGLVSGKVKIAVIDPRFSKTASKAWKWIPIKPGTEGAFALAMIRWIIENRKYDERYLSNANKAAAKEDGEPTWTNATWLVKIVDGKPEKFLRASELGIGGDQFVVLTKEGPKAFEPYDEDEVVEGELFVDTEIKGYRVKSALRILYESSSSKSLKEWAEICEVNPRDIVELADEFTKHGKKAAADIHRGVSQHTNGFYNVTCWMNLNLLIGNFDWKGGMIKASTYSIMGGKKGQPFDLSKMHPAKMTPFGISIIRHEVKYEETTIFDGYPAKRQWYPLSSDVYQEILPSIGDEYPYPIKVLFLYMGTPVYSLPAGHTNIPILMDTNRLPLFIAIDITIGTTSLYADYIFPDLSYLERWEFAGSHPNIAPKVQPIRQPVVEPMVEKVKVFGKEMPLSLEALLLKLAEKLGLPGFGKDGFGKGQDFLSMDDYYIRMVANVAMEDEPVPNANDEEVKLFLESRKHLSPAIFDPERWRSILGDDLWRKVVFVLNRGGRFEDYYKAYPEGELVKNKYGRLINMYQEKTSTTKDAITGVKYPGFALYISSPRDVSGKEIKDDGYNLITYRTITMTKSRTITNYWLLSLEPENYLLINKKDAEALGLKQGDAVKITSATNPEGIWDLGNGVKKPMIGKVKIVEGIKPGVIAFSLGYGHWATGAKDTIIDGVQIKGDERREKGIHANAAMRIDPIIKNTCLTDIPGGSAVFYDTKVKILKVTT